MKELEQEIRRALGAAFLDVDFGDVEVAVAVAPEGVEADYSSNVAMRVVKMVGRPPMEIAEKIAGEISGFKCFVSAPGFLNFISPDGYFLDKLKAIAGSAADFEKFISCDEYKDKMVVCEFSDPNPFKVLHVGHLYTSVVGDGLSRLFEFAGAKVARTNFGGDVGLHVAKTMYALGEEMGVDLGGEVPREQLDGLTIEKIAECYVIGSREYEENEAAHAEIVELNKKLYRIATEKVREGALAEIYWKGREISYQYFDDFYARVGVKFDKYYPESTVAGRGLEKVLEELENGVYTRSDGAVVYEGEKVGLHTRVFVNRGGLPTYETKDVGVLFEKWDDYHFDESVVITGNDIIDYMKVVLASVHEYAPELAERTTHITHSNVRLPGAVKMASRKGNFLKAVDVIEMVKAALEAEYGTVDERVLFGAIKYAFLKYKIGGGDISFDAKESVGRTGNSGPYLQYAAVRGRKILEKCGYDGGAIGDLTGDLEPTERGLVKKIVQYPEILETAVVEKAPHKLCMYLYELAQEFSRFYEQAPVAGSEREKERLVMVFGYLRVLEHGLGLLGIEVPEEM